MGPIDISSPVAGKVIADSDAFSTLWVVPGGTIKFETTDPEVRGPIYGKPTYTHSANGCVGFEIPNLRRGHVLVRLSVDDRFEVQGVRADGTVSQNGLVLLQRPDFEDPTMKYTVTMIFRPRAGWKLDPTGKGPVGSEVISGEPLGLIVPIN